MDGIGFDDPLEIDGEPGEEADAPGASSVISIEQLQRLVQLLDRSDVSEVELAQANEGVYLVLRKVKAAETSPDTSAAPVLAVPSSMIAESANSAAPASASAQTEHKVAAPLVGTFHVWAKPKGGALVAVGDRVKAGQLVGTIQSLNVLNEVETSVAGRVVNVHVQDGQPVEYGQILMTIDSSDGMNGA